MKGRISLKDFIHGVKKELLDAAATSEGGAAFEMTEVELEAEFVLEASAKAEGGFSLLVKAAGETLASQTHKVKITLRPLKNQPTAISGKNPTSSESRISNSLVSLIMPKTFHDNPVKPPSTYPFYEFELSRTVQADAATLYGGFPYVRLPLSRTVQADAATPYRGFPYVRLIPSMDITDLKICQDFSRLASEDHA